MEITQFTTRLPKRWLVETCLPLWSRVGWDRIRGGFAEQLFPSGEADFECKRRVRVQARQIHVYAEANFRGFGNYSSIVTRGVKYLLETAVDTENDGGYVHILYPNGDICDRRRDTYDHAFILLALASVAKSGLDIHAKSMIYDVLQYIDTRLAREKGGYVEGVPHVGPRRQNPHMHLFEAYMALFDATQDAEHLERAEHIFSFVFNVFFDHDSGRLLEYVNDDLTRISGPTGRIVEPGHMAEWVWLLGRFERITGTSTSHLRQKLLSAALDYACDDGCLPDEAFAVGGVTRYTRRLWPQTELVKAHLTQYSFGIDAARQDALEAMKRVFDLYISLSATGTWIDVTTILRTEMGLPIPASSLYHIYTAIIEFDDLLGSIDREEAYGSI